MKVNLNKMFIDCFGKEIKGKNIAEQVCIYLFNLGDISGQAVDAERKYMAYNLSKRIADNPDLVELTTEEGTFIKKVCNEQLSAGAYGQVVDLIEGK